MMVFHRGAKSSNGTLSCFAQCLTYSLFNRSVAAYLGALSGELHTLLGTATGRMVEKSWA